MNIMGIGDWGLGIGIGVWGLGPIPNPPSPIPNPPIPIFNKINSFLKCKYLNIKEIFILIIIFYSYNL